MAEKRKFAALAELHRTQDEAETPLLVKEAIGHATDSVGEEARGRGRPATGKRSNPEWKLYSHFLKKRTQRAAVARLQAADDGRDLSDVLQELLENWLKV
ncbi:hypothetical protein [Acidiphilium multivorum]|uniref:hypothetical protein n=1 Tax=Acidiphilium multivorum TaxID=62140 RepID=UPI001B8C7A15|nr:hypothetical protein [Acidiphilium multivorum]MBS3025405.1 hypothetical protein [Acidiphilium multivorum]